MTKKNFLWLVGIFILLGGLFALTEEDKGKTRAPSLVNLFSDVSAQAVQKIQIIQGQENATLALLDDNWVVESRGYPADAGKVRSLLLKIFGLRVSQKITSNPKSYDKLGVTEEGEGLQIKLLGEKQELASLLLGELRQQSNAPGAVGAGQYVRRGQDEDVYLISEALSFSSSDSRWLQEQIINVLASNIVQVTQTVQGKEAFVLGREVVDAEVAKDGEEASERKEGEKKEERESEVLGEFTLVGELSSQKLSDSSLSQITGALENLRLSDVLSSKSAAAEGLDFNFKTVYRLQDGGAYTVETAEQEEKFYARLSFTSGGSAPQVNAEFQKWTYQIPKYIGKKFRLTAEDIVAK